MPITISSISVLLGNNFRLDKEKYSRRQITRLTWNHSFSKSLTTIDPGVLIDRNWNPLSSISSFVVTNSVTSNFSNMESNSVAAPLMDFEGDDMRLMAGKTNRSSSLGTSVVALLAYSEKPYTSLYIQ